MSTPSVGFKLTVFACSTDWASQAPLNLFIISYPLNLVIVLSWGRALGGFIALWSLTLQKHQRAPPRGFPVPGSWDGVCSGALAVTWLFGRISLLGWNPNSFILVGALEVSPEWVEITVGLVILIKLKIVSRTNCLILIGINIALNTFTN